MNPGGSQNEQELFTFRALAEQAQDPNFDVAQIMHHLQANMAAMNQLQQQFGNLQNLVQEQAQHPNQVPPVPAPITSLHATVEALANSHLEQQQMQQSFQSNVQHILDRLSLRSTGASRVPIPQPLSTKFKGDDNELSYSDFKAKLQTVFARFPDSLSSDHDKIQYALQSMDGTPFKYFAPYVNRDAEDVEGILEDYEKFLAVLEETHGDQNNLDEVESKLLRLRQHGSTMASYIASFRTLDARLRWNEAALVARFKDGLSDEVKASLAPYWNTLKTLRDTQNKATTVYNNLATQHRLRSRNPVKHNPVVHRRPLPSQTAQVHANQASAPNDVSMDLDAIRSRQLSAQEKQRRRDANLCLYCGGAGHQVRDCDVKKGIRVATVTFDDEDQGNDMV
jgi:hypothetical protein